MRRPFAPLLLASIALASCRAGAREGLGPTGIPIGAERTLESATGPASDAGTSVGKPPTPPTVWKAEYYKISDG